MLSLKNVSAAYGRIQALRDVSLEVSEGEIVTLIGANGAGKTTLLMSICACLAARSGEISFRGIDISRMPTYQIIRLGLAHVPEGRRIFPRLTVLENLQLGAISVPKENFAADLEYVFSLLPQLKEKLGRRGGTLSGGEQQMLAIGRALMARPRLLLLDEPSLGLAPLVTAQVFSLIRQINREQGMTVLLIEQNAFQALKLATRGYVMVNGCIAQSGLSASLLADPAVRQAYLEGTVAV